MKTFLIPVVYTVYGRVPVEANTAREAMKWAKDHQSDLPVPKDGRYLDDSFEIDYDGLIMDEAGILY